MGVKRRVRHVRHSARRCKTGKTVGGVTDRKCGCQPSALKLNDGKRRVPPPNRQRAAVGGFHDSSELSEMVYETGSK